jgi:hypothetical protein
MRVLAIFDRPMKFGGENADHVPHPPESSDPAQNDFLLFGSTKRNFAELLSCMNRTSFRTSRGFSRNPCILSLLKAEPMFSDVFSLFLLSFSSRVSVGEGDPEAPIVPSMADTDGHLEAIL